MLLATLGLTALLFSPTAAQPLFTDVTASAGIPALPSGEGVNFIDFDADGRPDLFLPVVKGPDRLFHNEGDGRFTDVSAARGIHEGNGIGAVCGDLDGDGLVDLYVLRGAYPSGTNVLYLQSPAGRFEDHSIASGLTAQGNHMSAILVDLEASGRPAVFGVNWGRNSLHLNESRPGKPHFRETAESAGLDAEAKSWGAVSGDFNDDGLPDLAVARGTVGKDEPCRLYLNDGAGRFLDRTAGTGIERVTRGMGVVSADFDGDSRLDLFFTSYDGPGRLFLNDGRGSFRDATAGSGIQVARSVGAAAGDLDGDLRPELVVAGFEQPVRIFRNLGGGRFEELIGSSGLGTFRKNEGVALADMDGDGDLDLYVANYDGHNRLYRNNTPVGPCLKVRPRVGPSPAVGATIRLWRAGGLGKPEALLARQELQAGYGFCSQGPSELVFRLPDDGPFDLSVAFPGGTAVELRAVKPGLLEVPKPPAGR